MNKKSNTAKTAKRKSKKKLFKTFLVNVNVHISGEEEVKARTWQEAVRKAKKQYFKRDHDNYTHGIDTPEIDLNFSEYEDEVEVL